MIKSWYLGQTVRASYRGSRLTESSATLPRNGNIYGRGVELFADWFYRSFLTSLKISQPCIWMRCKPSYLISLTPKYTPQLFTISLRGVAGYEKQSKLVQLRGVLPFITPRLVSKKARLQTSLYFLISQPQIRELVIRSTASHQKELYIV